MHHINIFKLRKKKLEERTNGARVSHFSEIFFIKIAHIIDKVRQDVRQI